MARRDVDSLSDDPECARETYMLSSILARGYARNTAMFLRQILGLYVLANGTSRRVLDTLSGLGIVASYQTLNRILTAMSEVAEKNIRRVAHDPDGVVVYDNFNFMNRVRELAGGKQDHFVNLTTACLVACPSLKGPLFQRSLNLRQKFTHDMILTYLLPRRPSLDEASKYLLKFAIMDLFKLEDPPEYPAVDLVSYSDSPYIQLGAIFENEGTIDGVYQVHEELWKHRLEFKEYDERLTLVYGDQKTTSFIRRIKQSQSEASDPWERKKWMVPVPALFHVELNLVEMIFRVFWDTGDKGVRSNAVISSDVNFFQRGRHINRKSIRYHQAVPLLIHGFTGRILALVLGVLRDKGHINVPMSDVNVDFVKGLMADLDPGVLDAAMEEVWSIVFTREGWTGRYPGVSDNDIDLEFRSQCRLLQVVEILLTVHEAVRHGDYGLLRDIIPQLPIMFWG
ncbi:hypothetical protein F4861DRAFT_544588, partial [Xylaria intraflava]